MAFQTKLISTFSHSTTETSTPSATRAKYILLRWPLNKTLQYIKKFNSKSKQIAQEFWVIIMFMNTDTHI